MGILAQLRSRWTEYIGKGDVDVRITGLESLAVDQVAPVNQERARAGREYVWGPISGVTGIAPVAALPTTTAQWAIWNADPFESLIIEELGALLVSGTAAPGQVLLACLFQSPMLAGSVTGMQISNASSGNRASRAVFKSAVTITQPAAPNWWPVAVNSGSNTGVLSVGVESRNLGGTLIVPPISGLGLCVLSGTGTTPLFAPYGRHFEAKLDLE